jgi:catechol 2,3-dioxygenase-like lactoylglutathione lyase family enzyme
VRACRRTPPGGRSIANPTQEEIRMKRFHVHLGVADLDQSIRFYSGLFGAPPSVRKDDYAKWMIEDPRVNFAISTRGGEVGVNHLGLQADSADELSGIREQFAAADQASLQDEPDASCCYAKSDKHWVTDPQGIAWEGYHTLGEVRFFSSDTADTQGASACCTPASTAAEPSTAVCCAPAQAAASACCAPAKVDATAKATARCCA